MRKTGRPPKGYCAVCWSPNLARYQLEHRVNKRTYWELAVISSKRFKEKITAREFKRHFSEEHNG